MVWNRSGAWSFCPPSRGRSSILSIVPYETDEPPEAIVATVFQARSPLVHRYVAALLTRGMQQGLLGPAEPARIWQRHILNCAVLAPVFDDASAVCDVGSGAGLPGIVLALARPDLAMTLVEPQLRRYRFLAEVVQELGLRVEVVRGRVQDLAGSRTFDYVTARAVTRLDRLVEWTLPLWGRAGELVAIKGDLVGAELEAASAKLHRMPVGSPRIERYGCGVVTPPTTVARIKSRPEVSI
jgi:16S rRNA (guanine527-N7)-methyltransferase